MSPRVGRLIPMLVVAAIMAARTAPAGQCWFQTITGVAFGSYDPTATQPTDSTGSISFRCNPGTRAIIITLGGGLYGSVVTRQMATGAERLGYGLFLDAARTVIWGDGTGGTEAYGPVDPPAWDVVTLPVYGRIPGGQDVPSGVYGDTVVVTINF